MDSKTSARYLRIVAWARRRYRNPDGSITVMVGGIPSPYLRLVDGAFARLTRGL